MGRVTTRHRIVRVNLDTGVSERADTVAVEEPLEIRVGGVAVTVTMRTPGNDIELVHGFLASEGIVHAREDVRLARYCADTETLNVVDVTLSSPGDHVPVSAQRSLVMHGGCGLCGKTSIDAVAAARPSVTMQDPERPMVAAETLGCLPTRLRGQQHVFERTGGVHAAGLFTAEGEALVVREDIGRHNAVDKVVGWALMNGRSCADLILMVSSRGSFEIVQKAAMAGVPVVACVSAPSSLAIEAATELGVTLAAFTRGRTLSICSHPARVQMPSSA